MRSSTLKCQGYYRYHQTGYNRFNLNKILKLLREKFKFAIYHERAKTYICIRSSIGRREKGV